MRSKNTAIPLMLVLAMGLTSAAWAQGREGGAPAGRAPAGVIVGPYDCCLANGGTGCSDPACEALICGADPFCCDVEWDQVCASEALAQCALCLDASDCCLPSGGTGCSDATCEAQVCAQDAFCCDVQWDQLCAELAWQTCEICGAYVPPIIQEIPTLSKTGLGILAVAMLLGGALLLRRRRAA